MNGEEYINGYIERHRGGKQKGVLRIERIDLSPIEGRYFTNSDGRKMLWLKRTPMLVYDDVLDKYERREKKPMWEAYLFKQQNSGDIAYRGEFVFLRFRFSIVGIWDKVLTDKFRLNLFVERMPMKAQNIIKKIAETKKKFNK